MAQAFKSLATSNAANKASSQTALTDVLKHGIPFQVRKATLETAALAHRNTHLLNCSSPPSGASISMPMFGRKLTG
jgi:hypothetical protein